MLLLSSASAAAEPPLATPPSAAASAAPAVPTAPSVAPGSKASGVPTSWVMIVTGEKDGVPWMKTTTPETMGGTVKGTGTWSCSYAATQRGAGEGTAWEQMEVSCAVGDAEVFLTSHCAFRTKAKPGTTPGKRWKRGELQTLNLRRRNDVKSTITVSLRCDVDAALSTE
jgi:hypothetical protein